MAERLASVELPIPFISRRRFRVGFLLALLSGLLCFSAIAPHSALAAGEIEISAVSSRSDMASGGTSLVQVEVPPSLRPSSVRVTRNTSSVTDRFEAIEGNPRILRGLIELDQPVTKLVARATGWTPARLLIVDHSIDGPILSGPRQAPYPCETPDPPISQDDCSAATTVEYRYRLESGGGWFAVDDPADIPLVNLLRRTVTEPTGERSEGVNVAELFRMETGTINRANYRIAFLVDPEDPDRPGAGWNGRLVFGFGGGCTGGFRQGSIDNETQYAQLSDVLDGYAGAGSSQNVFGTRCSDSVSAETLSMVKERFIKAFAVPDFTIGKGGSGGSMAQQMIANNFPGLLDGIELGNSFTDNAFAGNMLMDCRLINEFLASPEAAGWSNAQKRAVKGMNRETACAVVYAAFGDNFFAPGDSCPNLLPGAGVFDPLLNPGGTRCTVFEGNVNVYGIDPGTGLVRSPVDNVGVQYGLEPLKAGTLSIDQFLDLNDGVGSIRQFDNVSVPQRAEASTEALRRAYDSGQLNMGGAGLASTPAIDNRKYSIETSDNVHQTIHALSMRERLLAANGDPDGDGSAGTQVIWSSPESIKDELQRLTMDRWLTAIKADRTELSKREKVLANRPESIDGSPAAYDACFGDSSGSLISRETQTADLGICGGTFPSYSGTRLEAGQPLANDILKCQLKPIEASEYEATFSPSQMARLRSMFPDGVCDNSKPGVESEISRQTWRVLPASPEPDLTSPDTVITTALKSVGQSGSVNVGFSASETGSTFECRFDSARFRSCSPPASNSNLAIGFHKFEARATDPAGNTDQTAARVNFVVGYPEARIALRSRRVAIDRKGRGRIKVRCTPKGMKNCRGRVPITVKRRVLGASGKAAKKNRRVAAPKFKVRGGKRTIRLRLGGKLKRKLRGKRQISAKAVFKVTRAGRSRSKSSRRLILVRRG